MAADTFLAQGAGLNYRLPQNQGFDPMIEQQKQRDERKAQLVAAHVAKEAERADKNYQDYFKSVSLTSKDILPYYAEDVEHKATAVHKYLDEKHRKDSLYNPYSDRELAKLVDDFKNTAETARLASKEVTAADAAIRTLKPDEVEHTMIDYEGKPTPAIELIGKANNGDKKAGLALELGMGGKFNLAGSYFKEKAKPYDPFKNLATRVASIDPVDIVSKNGLDKIYGLTPAQINVEIDSEAQTDPNFKAFVADPANRQAAYDFIDQRAKKVRGTQFAPESQTYGAGENKNARIGEPVRDVALNGLIAEPWINAQVDKRINSEVADAKARAAKAGNKDFVPDATKITEDYNKVYKAKYAKEFADKYSQYEFVTTQQKGIDENKQKHTFTENGKVIKGRPDGFLFSPDGKKIEYIFVTTDAIKGTGKEADTPAEAEIVKATPANMSSYLSGFGIKDLVDKGGYVWDKDNSGTSKGEPVKNTYTIKGKKYTLSELTDMGYKEEQISSYKDK